MFAMQWSGADRLGGRGDRARPRTAMEVITNTHDSIPMRKSGGARKRRLSETVHTIALVL